MHLASTLVTYYQVKNWKPYPKASGNLNGKHRPLTCQIAGGKEPDKISSMYVFTERYGCSIRLPNLELPVHLKTCFCRLFRTMHLMASSRSYLSTGFNYTRNLVGRILTHLKEEYSSPSVRITFFIYNVSYSCFLYGSVVDYSIWFSRQQLPGYFAFKQETLLQ